MAYTHLDGSPWSYLTFEVLDPVLGNGETVRIAGTTRTKTGDGVHRFSMLPYDPEVAVVPPADETHSPVLVLAADDPVPVGTPTGTVIVRTA